MLDEVATNLEGSRVADRLKVIVEEEAVIAGHSIFCMEWFLSGI